MNKLPARIVREKAVISDCGFYRYWLSREIRSTGKIKPIVFVMLNPSTADANNDDPTIRRCIGYAKSWGGSHLIVVNLFAFRATNPDVLWDRATIDPVGALNDEAIEIACDYAYAHEGKVVVAWGEHGAYMDRGYEVLTHIEQFKPVCLKLNKSGSPAHPLYQRKDAVPVELAL